jgi:hypothetical protein
MCSAIGYVRFTPEGGPVFDETGFTQACPECGNEIGRIIRRPAAENSNDRHRRLLRTCRERQSRYCSATDYFEKLAPPHRCPEAKDTGPYRFTLASTHKIAVKGSVHVRFGS